MGGLANGATVDGHGRDRQRDLVVVDRREVGEHRPERDAAPDERLERRALQARQPVGAHQQADRDEQDGQRDGQHGGGRRCGTSCQEPQGDGSRGDRPARPATAGHSAGEPGERRQAQAAAVRGQKHVRRCQAAHTGQTVMKSFMAANLASPMPGTFLISSMVLKPPLAVR